jgi:cobalt-zinc-cadmium resistance protein CzcA
MHRIVELALENRILVLLAVCLFIVMGYFALKNLTIDAVPDITNVQVQVLTKSPSLVQDQATYFDKRGNSSKP